MTLGKTEIANRLIILIGFFAFVIANVLYDYTTKFDNVYYEAQAFAFTCYAFALARRFSVVGRLVFWVCLGQLGDELFGNPLEPNIWEWVSFTLFFVYEFLKYKKWLKV